MMEGEVSLVAGRSQREKRRSYKDLLREEEIIDAEVRKSSKKRPKESDGFVVSTEFHKKKKKHHDDYHYKGHYGVAYELLDDDSSSSAEEEEGGQLVIDDSFNQYRKKSKKSKKSKKKKDKEKERRHSSKSNGSSDAGLYAAGRSGSHSDKKRKKEEKARLKAEKAKKKVLTAYQIFSKEYRLSILEEQPGLDFGDLSKKLADAWKQLPEGDKQVWRERAEYLQHKQMKYESTTSKHSKHSQPKPAKDTSKTKGVAQFPGVVTPTPAATQPKRPEPAVTLPQNGPSPVAEPSPSPLRDPEVDPIDAAAHLQLLGESLSLIGRRLQETEGMVTVSGSLSVLLDSVLCALGPLACLTAQVPELNGCPAHILSNTLDNIAYVMPGL
ncbi:HMG domain-containing protein 4-like isoform X2 [Neoarius graeffei]|uniref:HMG domain-containing protein 4-like isoform X2 n=1 Tax=Neoarius graeffei TaxID=443677 RepID=UPI00298CADC4|nr:HMG domain-containing protein 4-like isoform X2 [Neoarius graeffei]